MSLTVKELAKKYGVSARDIMRELNEQGIETENSVDSVIPISDGSDDVPSFAHPVSIVAIIILLNIKHKIFLSINLYLSSVI